MFLCSMFKGKVGHNLNLNVFGSAFPTISYLIIFRSGVKDRAWLKNKLMNLN